MKQKRKSRKFRYFIFYKPYGVLCQFSDKNNRKTIADFARFPKDIYPVGRLDFDSEGLVLLTNDGMLKYRLLDPKNRHPRTYIVQVEHSPTETSLKKLRIGITIEGRRILPAFVEQLPNEPPLPVRPKPIRFRKNIPTSWLKIILYEGRNRQVRKMTAAIGHPTLRLVRTAIGPLTLEGLEPGQSRKLTPIEVNELRKSIM